MQGGLAGHDAGHHLLREVFVSRPAPPCTTRDALDFFEELKRETDEAWKTWPFKDAARAAIAAGGGAGVKGDLLVYGMLSAMEGMTTLREALDEGGDELRAWYERMKGVVGASARVVV